MQRNSEHVFEQLHARKTNTAHNALIVQCDDPSKRSVTMFNTTTRLDLMHNQSMLRVESGSNKSQVPLRFELDIACMRACVLCVHVCVFAH